MGHTLISSAVDLRDDGNRTQAKHELDQATDFGGEAELAAWARKWGEAALEIAEAGSVALERADEDPWGI